MKSFSYKDAGVDIDAGNKFVNIIKPMAQKTRRAEVISGIGGFSALFEIPLHQYKEPVIVSSTDGVGTKLRLAYYLKQHDTIGIDLVAMCVNDLLPSGAEPVFFLDYFATGQLDLAIAEEIMRGITKGCLLAGASLVGGETAEMPGLYQGTHYDLAGFAVGIVEKSKMIQASNVKSGDILIALPSSGVHSNGFSLILSLIEQHKIDLHQSFGAETLGEALLTPTRIYVDSLLPLIKEGIISGAAHITGGGITENLPRVLPKGLDAWVDFSDYELPPLFQWIQNLGKIETSDMLRTFNCGIGMVLIVPEEKMNEALTHLRNKGEQPWLLGYIQSSEGDTPQVQYEGNFSP